MFFLAKTLKFGNLMKYCDHTKSQIKPKTDCHVVDSPKNKRTNLFYFFHFHGKQNKFVRSFFGRIFDAPKLLLVLTDLYASYVLKKVNVVKLLDY